ncbi:MAG: membrane integrity-associated transporter subunit PqiC [Desulfobacterales bacterium]|nr:membrane integrity-associated transporter subunit PqiC [Desulfobacterales bacterium]
MRKKIVFSTCRGTLIFSLAALVFAGCRGAAPAVTFYHLTPLENVEGKGLEQAAMQNILIGIGPVRIPEYLNRPQIVSRSGANRFSLSEFNRWGGYLDKNFMRVMVEDISLLLSTNRVLLFPWGDQADPDYRVAFDIHQFDGQLDGSVLLNVTWTIKDKNGSENLYWKKSIIQQSVSGPDYDALVSAHSRAIAELSREIVGTIKTIVNEADDN